MKFASTLFFLFITSLVVSQKVERKTIPGTRLSMETFGEMSIAKHSPIVSFEDKMDLSIVEMTDSAAYSKTKEDISLKSIKAQGFVVVENRKLTIDGYAGEMFLVEVGDAQYGFSCYFGDNTFLAMCTGVYLRADEAMLSQILRSVQSIKVNTNAPIDWNSYFSFTYDSTSIFQLDLSQNHNLGIRFTPNGKEVSSLYEETAMLCLQTRPSLDTYSAQDVINFYLVPQLGNLEISDVMIDEQQTLNETDSYLFHAKCSTDEHEFELYSRAFFHDSAVILITAYISEDHRKEAKSFVDSIALKKDGF